MKIYKDVNGEKIGSVSYMKGHKARTKGLPFEAYRDPTVDFCEFFFVIGSNFVLK
jgi:hypothetical protein